MRLTAIICNVKELCPDKGYFREKELPTFSMAGAGGDVMFLYRRIFGVTTPVTAIVVNILQPPARLPRFNGRQIKGSQIGKRWRNSPKQYFTSQHLLNNLSLLLGESN